MIGAAMQTSLLDPSLVHRAVRLASGGEVGAKHHRETFSCTNAGTCQICLRPDGQGAQAHAELLSLSTEAANVAGEGGARAGATHVLAQALSGVGHLHQALACAQEPLPEAARHGVQRLLEQRLPLPQARGLRARPVPAGVRGAPYVQLCFCTIDEVLHVIPQDVKVQQKVLCILEHAVHEVSRHSEKNGRSMVFRLLLYRFERCEHATLDRLCLLCNLGDGLCCTIHRVSCFQANP
mmetsp:Transcript_61864/g.180811  ORF Transcript_61864/g.180811 Transcript_61864/m.180811 type:complete len:237 (-) Transcript_61864:257-967(-)